MRNALDPSERHLGTAVDEGIAADVRRGLTASCKSLPPYLFYDASGSALYEQITELDEYYLTRAERHIFAAHAGEIVSAVQKVEREPLGVVELGAGSATKTTLILQALVERQGRARYVPIDVSPSALDEAAALLARTLPAVTVQPLAMTHHEALPRLSALDGPQMVLFIGSSIGNLDDDAAVELLDAVRRALGGRAWLLLGTDLRKSPARLLPAYDDARGVTAAFNKNLLVRLNRELGAHFNVDRFVHRARWNAVQSRVEMHLESTARQRVAIDALGIEVPFAAGETIHTESSVKYDLPHVDRILTRAGFTRSQSWLDDERLFAVHLAASRR